MKLALAALAAALLLLPATVAQAQAVEFKGTPLGAPFEQFQSDHPEFHCRTYAPGRSSCSVTSFTCPGRATSCLSGMIITTFAGEPSKFINAEFYDGLFASVFVTIRPSSYDAISNALAEKYGPAKRSSSTVSNRAGFSATNDTSDWRRPDAILFS